MALNSYFDFAENDFQYFKASYDAGIVANMMGAMAQGICEKYMKHLISEYYKPDDAMQQKDFENILLLEISSVCSDYVYAKYFQNLSVA